MEVTKAHSYSVGPGFYPVPDVPGYGIKFTQFGQALNETDCISLLLIAELKLLSVNPKSSVVPGGTYPSLWDSVYLSLVLERPLSKAILYIFLDGIRNWGQEYGFVEVAKIELINSQGSSLVNGWLTRSGPRTATIQNSHSNHTISGSNNPTLWPLPTVPGLFLRVNIQRSPLPRRTFFGSLSKANDALLALYRRSPQGSRPTLANSMVWADSGVSFRLVPESGLLVIDALLFVIGIEQWGSQQGYTELSVDLIKRIGGSRGELEQFGSAMLLRTPATAAA